MSGSDPAFPFQATFVHPEKAWSTGEPMKELLVNTGLTKRELFAAMAMWGEIAGRYANPNPDMVLKETYKKVSERSLKQADALLAELERGAEGEKK